MDNACKRFEILGCCISAETVETALAAVAQRKDEGTGGYVCFSNVHTVITSRTHSKLRQSTNNSFMSLPDGKPLSIYARLTGYKHVEQVAGPDFMPQCIKQFPGARHFFYGSTEDVLNDLERKLRLNNPDIQIAGKYSPPFRELSESEMRAVRRKINQSKPDFVWVGLGAPKQEVWMNENHEVLKPAILFGVGAAFDFHAGKTKRCPEWMQKFSLEWLYRLCSEPRRLWKRYLVTNTKFMFLIVFEIVRARIRLHR